MALVRFCIDSNPGGVVCQQVDGVEYSTRRTLPLASAIRLVHRGEMMITQEIAKTLFSHSLQSVADSFAKSGESDYGLTEKELKVLRLISQGLSNRQIAEYLFLSEGTVKNYISSIHSKLHVANRVAAMKKVVDEHLL